MAAAMRRVPCGVWVFVMLLAAVGLGAVLVRCAPPLLRDGSTPVPTVAPVVTVLPTLPQALPTSTVGDPSPTVPVESLLTTPTRTPVPPLILVPTETPTATPTASDGTPVVPTRAVQRG